MTLQHPPAEFEAVPACLHTYRLTDVPLLIVGDRDRVTFQVICAPPEEHTSANWHKSRHGDMKAAVSMARYVARRWRNGDFVNFR